MDCAHSINDSHTVVRHIRKNYGIGANADIIPNLYPSDYLHTGSDIYIISDDGGSRSLTIRQCIPIRSSPVEKITQFSPITALSEIKTPNKS